MKKIDYDELRSLPGKKIEKFLLGHERFIFVFDDGTALELLAGTEMEDTLCPEMFIDTSPFSEARILKDYGEFELSSRREWNFSEEKIRELKKQNLAKEKAEVDQEERKHYERLKKKFEPKENT